MQLTFPHGVAWFHHPTDAVSTAVSLGADPGWVYLSAARRMPGFVHVGSSAEDPRGFAWSLRSFSGETRFRTVFAMATCDCAELESQFRAAWACDQIPHHGDLFKIPLRFARQILAGEARAFPSRSVPRPSWKAPLMGGGLVLGLAAAIVAIAWPTERSPIAREKPSEAVVERPQFRGSMR